MKENMKKYLVIMGCFAALMVSIVGGQRYFDEEVYCNVRLQHGISVARITDKSLEQLVIWEEQRDISFHNPMLEKRCSGECLYIVGKLEKMQKWNILDGTLNLDEEGVLVTSEVAQELYHSNHVVGQKLECMNNIYEIRGVVQEERNRVYLLAAKLNLNTGKYEWTQAAKNQDFVLPLVGFSIDRKKILFKKMEEILAFQLEKNGYPEIDVISYPR